MVIKRFRLYCNHNDVRSAFYEIIFAISSIIKEEGMFLALFPMHAGSHIGQNESKA